MQQIEAEKQASTALQYLMARGKLKMEEYPAAHSSLTWVILQMDRGWELVVEHEMEQDRWVVGLAPDWDGPIVMRFISEEEGWQTLNYQSAEGPECWRHLDPDEQGDVDNVNITFQSRLEYLKTVDLNREEANDMHDRLRHALHLEWVEGAQGVPHGHALRNVLGEVVVTLIGDNRIADGMVRSWQLSITLDDWAFHRKIEGVFDEVKTKAIELCREQGFTFLLAE